MKTKERRGGTSASSCSLGGWLVGIALAVGLLAAIMPAWRAYRTDVAGILARG